MDNGGVEYVGNSENVNARRSEFAGFVLIKNGELEWCVKTMGDMNETQPHCLPCVQRSVVHH